jgi:hypothetical protein
MRVIRSAQFELSVDGVPRSYRDRKDLALAQILKSRNPNSVVKLKDLQTGKRSSSRSSRGNNNGGELTSRSAYWREGLASESKWCENQCGSVPVASFTRPH